MIDRGIAVWSEDGAERPGIVEASQIIDQGPPTTSSEPPLLDELEDRGDSRLSPAPGPGRGSRFHRLRTHC